MAIQLERELAQGVSANYWRIRTFNINLDYGGDDMGEAFFDLYKSAEDAAAGKRPFDRSKVNVQTTGGISGDTKVSQIINALENAAIAEGGPLEGGIKV